jgi:hypothetical protein
MAIEDLFPDQTIPDENNYLPDGNQFKAPDHCILNGSVLIERKSGNAVDNSQFYQKLSDIAKEQGHAFYGFGKFNLGHLIKELPDPAAASRKMTDFMLSQTWKRVSDARRKFEEYAAHCQNEEQSRLLIFSDNSTIKSSTAMHEYFLARKMGGFENSDQTGIIDAIIFVKDPRLVLDEPNSYWFKFLVKGRVSKDAKDKLTQVVLNLHNRIAHYSDYLAAVRNARVGSFRVLLV